MASLTVFLVASGLRCLTRGHSAKHAQREKQKEQEREIKRHQEKKNSLDIIPLLLRETNAKPLEDKFKRGNSCFFRVYFCLKIY